MSFYSKQGKQALSEELTLDQLNDLLINQRSVRSNSGLYGYGENGSNGSSSDAYTIHKPRSSIDLGGLRLLTDGGVSNATRGLLRPIGTGTLRAPKVQYSSDPNNLSARTLQRGFSLSGTVALGLGGGINGGVGIANDDQGNYALYRTYNRGLAAGTPSIAGAGQVAISNAETVHDLEGDGYFTSLGGGLGPHATVDGFTGKAHDGKTVIGGGVSAGPGAGWGSMAGKSTTYISPSINIRDIAEKIQSIPKNKKMPKTSDIIEYFDNKSKRR